MLFHLKSKLRRGISNKPILFFSLYRLIAPRAFKNAAVVNNKTEIVIEGFPRSANTFAIVAFNVAQGRKVRIAHLHAEAQILRGVQLGIPVIVLIRHPVDAIASLLIRHPGRSKEYAKRYVQFYSTVLLIHEQVVLANFRQVTEDFGAVIDKVNEKYATKFKPFINSQENIDNVFQRIANINHLLDGGKLTHVSLPVAGRSNKSLIEQNEPYILEAVRIYEKLFILSSANS